MTQFLRPDSIPFSQGSVEQSGKVPRIGLKEGLATVRVDIGVDRGSVRPTIELLSQRKEWWTWPGSNRRPPDCQFTWLMNTDWYRVCWKACLLRVSCDIAKSVTLRSSP